MRLRSIFEAAGVAIAMPSGMLLALAIQGTIYAAPAAAYCREMRTTGYVRSEFSSRTYDGTPIWTDEPIAAASWDIPLGAIVHVEGVGSFRVADRGLLGSSGWIDVAVWSRSEAHQITGVRNVCVQMPGETG